MESSREQFCQCFQPAFLPLFVTGCLSFRLNGQHQLEVSTFTKLYTNLARVAALGCFITGWAIKAYSNQYSQHLKEMSPLIKFLGFAELIISLATYIEISVIMDIRKLNHIELHERAYELDKFFSKEFPVNFNYQKTFRLNKIFMTVWMLYSGIYNMMYIVNLDSDWRVALIALGYTTCIIGPDASSYAHICTMEFLRIRFRLFQKMFKKYFCLDVKQEKVNRQSILSLLNWYQKYYELIQAVNNVYGGIAIVNYFHDFTQTTSMVFVLCLKAAGSKAPARDYVFLFMLVLPRLMKVIYIAVCSRSTIKESKACSQIIATYDDRYPVDEIKENIDAFLLWKKHNCFHFTVGKALKLNLGLVNSFFQGIGNYVLILIQLKLQETSIEERLKNKIHAENLSKIK